MEKVGFAALHEGVFVLFGEAKFGQVRCSNSPKRHQVIRTSIGAFVPRWRKISTDAYEQLVSQW
jgi:hypothetical protein